MKLYIHRYTGLLTAKLGDTSALQTVASVLGSTLYLDCVFYDDSGEIVELADGATAVFVAKQDKHYTDPSLIQALSWTKAAAAEDGYRFIIRPAGDALVALLANLDSASLIAQIAWTENDEERLTPKFALTVGNAVYRDNEPVIENPSDAWPLPADLLRKTDLAGFSGDVVIGDKTLTFVNGLITTIV